MAKELEADRVFIWNLEFVLLGVCVCCMHVRMSVYVVCVCDVCMQVYMWCVCVFVCGVCVSVCVLVRGQLSGTGSFLSA